MFVPPVEIVSCHCRSRDRPPGRHCSDWAKEKLEMEGASNSWSRDDGPPSVFHDLIEMALDRGLSNIGHIKDGTKDWLNIRPSTSHRVPSGYSTTLMQLHVDGDFNFYLEALNRLVQMGSVRSATCDRVDPELAGPLLDSVNGGLTVCQGRAKVPTQLLGQSKRKQAIEEGLANGNFISYPDYRYRSHDCKLVVDGQNSSIQCCACASQQYDPHLQSSLPATLDTAGLQQFEHRHAGPMLASTLATSWPTTSATTDVL